MFYEHLTKKDVVCCYIHGIDLYDFYFMWWLLRVGKLAVSYKGLEYSTSTSKKRWLCKLPPVNNKNYNQ